MAASPAEAAAAAHFPAAPADDETDGDALGSAGATVIAAEGKKVVHAFGKAMQLRGTSSAVSRRKVK